MNNPAEPSGNWHWRAAPGALRPELAERLRRLTELAGRLAPAASTFESTSARNTDSSALTIETISAPRIAVQQPST